MSKFSYSNGVITLGKFRYNLERAIVRSYLYDAGNRDSIGTDYVRNVLQNAYRRFMNIGPTAKCPDIDDNWNFLGAIDYQPWIEEAKIILARNDPKEMFSWLFD